MTLRSLLSLATFEVVNALHLLVQFYALTGKKYCTVVHIQCCIQETLIGKVDPITGEIIPNRSYEKKPILASSEVNSGPIPMTQVRRVEETPLY